MRHDLFYDRKSVHIKLTKELHTSLREKLFRYGITMQDLFHDAAEQALLEGVRSEKFLQRVAKKKLMATLNKTGRDERTKIGELDSETLYNLLEDTADDDKDDLEK